MSPKQWKSRLHDMIEATSKILNYCKHLKNEEEFKADPKTLDACIRNLQILGDASKGIPVSIQKELPSIPWKEIKGMRNVLVHEYFGASTKIIWRTIKVDLPKLKEILEKTSLRFDKPTHPWKICPAGEFYVRSANVDTYEREGHIVREHLRKEHCRESKNSSKDILTFQEATDMSEIFFQDLSGDPKSLNLGFGPIGNKYDSIIRGWTQYWNDIFKPEVALSPNTVKALIATESSFNSDAGKRKRSSAKGLMQLMPATIRYLRGEQGELKDHLFEFDDSEVYDPNLNIAAGIRWLFRKRETASNRLGRQATWEETVSEYKDYLRRSLKSPKAKQKGMILFQAFLKELNEKK